MDQHSKFAELSPTAYADASLGREQFMDMGIREMWHPIPRIAGSAYTVSCAPGDNLMLHAAIYRAEPGSIIVVKAGDVDYAMSGGNVCATAQKRGIFGFVIDGVIRDVAEVRELRFPVFARGAMPIPGKKNGPGTLQSTIICGGVRVDAGDIVVADEEGIAVIPAAQQDSIWEIAKQRVEKDNSRSLERWTIEHQAKIENKLKEIGFEE
ncbi:MAG: RraA family protein [Leptolyngbya sp. SIO3F4]|nr:RraA family protein [Leptolyngbya sp. SIO3F4]